MWVYFWCDHFHRSFRYWDHDAISSHLEEILTLSNEELLLVVFWVFTNTICSELGSLKGRTENSNRFCVMVTMPATNGQQRETPWCTDRDFVGLFVRHTYPTAFVRHPNFPDVILPKKKEKEKRVISHH